MTWRASSGARAWILQRLTAIYIALFLPLFFYCFLNNTPASYTEWREFVADPLMNTGLAFFFASVLLHAWVGLRDVVLDYIHRDRIRMLVLVLIAFTLLALAFGVLRTLIMVSQ